MNAQIYYSRDHGIILLQIKCDNANKPSIGSQEPADAG